MLLCELLITKNNLFCDGEEDDDMFKIGMTFICNTNE